MIATNLRVNGMVEALGIDDVAPRLSWTCEGGVEQTAFEVCAGAWSSGVVESNEMQVSYAGDLASRQRVEWRVRLRDEQGAWGPWSEPAAFEAGLLAAGDWAAKMIDPELTHTPDARQPASILRATFTCDDLDAPARMYVSAHGCYEARINGRRVGDRILAPGTGEYASFLPYQAYDVSDLLEPGENTVEVTLGDGWYRSAVGVEGTRNLFGEALGLIAQIEVAGKVVCATDASWEATQDGPICMSDLFQGEEYDARLEDESAWSWHAVAVDDAFDAHVLAAANAQPVREHERFEGERLTTPAGATVFDFGQNLAGYVELRCTAKGGEKLVLTHGEALGADGEFQIENFQPGERHKEGGIYQRVTYTCKPGLNVFKPHFCFFGFRYVQVEASEPVDDFALTSIAVYSSMNELTSFTCGNADVNQLFHNAVWSQKSNFLDTPTDCPTREKAGWTGDAGAFVNTGLYLMDCAPVFNKWLASVRVNQRDDGSLRNINPRCNKVTTFAKVLEGSAGWGDACVIVPWTLYLRSGDAHVLEENYETMCRWVDYLAGRAHTAAPAMPMAMPDKLPEGVTPEMLKAYAAKMMAAQGAQSAPKGEYDDYLVQQGVDYGEWCEPGLEMAAGVEQNGSAGTATQYLSYSAGLLAKAAGVLGRASDAEKYGTLSANAANAWHAAFTKDGRIESDRQKDYVRPLAFGLLSADEAKAAAADLDALVEACGYHLNTGFLSTPFLCKVLSESGHVEAAYRLLLQDTAPSWLYAVKKGATTIWETWRGIDEDGNVSASLNHYSYGAVCGWLVEDVCGIRYRFDEVVLAPTPSPLLGHAECTYDSPRGLIASSWRYDGDKVRYRFELPANVTATFELPSGLREQVGPGVHEYVA